MVAIARTISLVTTINPSQLRVLLRVMGIPTTILTQCTLPAKMADNTRREDSVVVATVEVVVVSLVVAKEVAIVVSIVEAHVTTKMKATQLISNLSRRSIKILKKRKKLLRTRRNNSPRTNTTLSSARRLRSSTSSPQLLRRKS